MKKIKYILTGLILIVSINVGFSAELWQEDIYNKSIDDYPIKGGKSSIIYEPFSDNQNEKAFILNAPPQEEGGGGWIGMPIADGYGILIALALLYLITKYMYHFSLIKMLMGVPVRFQCFRI